MGVSEILKNHGEEVGLLIGGVGLLLAAFARKITGTVDKHVSTLSTRNDQQHASNSSLLNLIAERVESVDGKVDVVKGDVSDMRGALRFVDEKLTNHLHAHTEIINHGDAKWKTVELPQEGT